MKIITCLLALVLISAAFLAADVNVAGKWSGSFVMSMGGESHDSTIIMNLKQEGANITGTVGPNDDQQWPVKTGKVESEKILLDVQSDGPLVHFELTLSGDHLKGGAKASHEGQDMTAKVDATRSK